MTSWSISSIDAFASSALTSTRGCITSLTLVSCRSSTPAIIVPSYASIPPLRSAPPTMRRSCSSETVAESSVRRPAARSATLDTPERPTATGPTRRASTLIGGTSVRATTSAFDTPSALGSSSPKRMVMTVSSTVAYASPRAPKSSAAIDVKSAVE